MNTLKFFARGDMLVSIPGPRAVGQAPRYVGREAKGMTMPATKEAFEVEADSEFARRLVKLTRRDQSLWPADEPTARVCGVPFVKLAFNDGSFEPVKEKN